MFSLSTKVRFFNRRAFCAKCLTKRNVVLFCLIFMVVWVLIPDNVIRFGRSVDTFDEVLDLRQERYLKYQASEMSRQGPGENGAAVSLTPEEIVKYKDVNEKEGFNFAASEKIALDRSVPDQRTKACKARIYPKELPRASVIIVYNNEAFSVIMRTAHSVINRSPPQYLEEVIFVDDFSTRPELADPFQEYIDKTWPDGIARIVRTPERYGLIKAKLFGAEAAVGEVLIFLDAHCEAGRGWIEPILADIKEDSSRVICPIIGNINSETMHYSAGGGSARGGFWWSMHFSWEPVPERDKKMQISPAHSYRSPTMAGGLFAADREFFFRIGAYDGKMEIWGGENLDLSFRAWMCHGSLLFHPCSLVGHIFRGTHPYGFPDKKRDYHGLNSKRVAEVWMDEFKQYYYLFRHDLVSTDVGDLSDRHAIREREKCHSFEWYLDNVYPEKFKLDKGVRAFGAARNPSRNYCFDVLNKDEKVSYSLGVYPCHPPMSAMNQILSLTVDGQIRREGTCLKYAFTRPGETPIMDTNCKKGDPAQTWLYDKDTKEIKHNKTGFCLDTDGCAAGDFIKIRECDHSDTQKWEWTNYYDNV